MARVNLNKAKRHLTGMVVPKQLHGNIGNIVEEELEKIGYKINKGKGADLESVEVKTRGVGATSAQTICKMSKTTIAATPFDQSIVKEKFQTQFRVKHQENEITGDNTIISAEEYDFTDEQIQKELKDGFEFGRAIIADHIANGTEPPHYIAPKGHSVYFERTDKTSNAWEVRVRASTMARWENIAKVNENPCFGD